MNMSVLDGTYFRIENDERKQDPHDKHERFKNQLNVTIDIGQRSAIFRKKGRRMQEDVCELSDVTCDSVHMDSNWFGKIKFRSCEGGLLEERIGHEGKPFWELAQSGARRSPVREKRCRMTT